MADLILASASPRRAELLQQIGVKFTCLPMNIDETQLANEDAVSYVQRLAQQKALAAVPVANGQPVLGSDTIVLLKGKLLGKPQSKQQAMDILSSLSGQTHEVITGVSLCRQVDDGIEVINKVVSTQVQFASLTKLQINAYIETGEPMDKAGAYGIQGKAAIFIEGIRGSYSNVVGLPLQETAQLLLQFNVPIWVD